MNERCLGGLADSSPFGREASLQGRESHQGHRRTQAGTDQSRTEFRISSPMHCSTFLAPCFLSEGTWGQVGELV